MLQDLRSCPVIRRNSTFCARKMAKEREGHVCRHYAVMPCPLAGLYGVLSRSTVKKRG